MEVSLPKTFVEAGPHQSGRAVQEWVDGSFRGNLGEVFIRCNNVLLLGAAVMGRAGLGKAFAQ